MRPTRHGVLLAAIVLMALLHALIQARVRPLYQVSDEMHYLFAGQQLVVPNASPAVAACAAPPDGTLLEQVSAGGKAGFRHTTALTLRVLCRNGGELPLFSLRVLNALSFPVLVLAAWGIAATLAGPRAGVLAALVAAMQPVAAKYAGAITPDAWANAFCALALLAGTRLVAGRGRWWDGLLLVWATALALAWKDTTYPLILHALLVFGWVGWRMATSRDASRSRGVVAARLTIVCVLVLLSGWRYRAFFATSYVDAIGYVAEERRLAPTEVPAAALADLRKHAGGFVGSAVLSLYRPWVYTPGRLSWHGQPLTPALPLAVLGLVAAGSLVGLVRLWTRGADVPWALVAIWSATGAVLMLQPSVRQVLLRFDDLHQGRWLFPMLAPAAAVAGIGLAGVVGRRAQGLCLVAVGAVATVWVVLIDIVRHHYLTFPDVLRRASLFVRPTGDIDIGDEAITALVTSLARSQPAWTFWGPIALLAATTAAVVWLAAGASREEPS